jgi:hypothetical protein
MLTRFMRLLATARDTQFSLFQPSFAARDPRGREICHVISHMLGLQLYDCANRLGLSL